jgi:hypothetical protein
LASGIRRIDHDKVVLLAIHQDIRETSTDVVALLRKHKILPSASELREIQFVPDKRIADKLQEAVLHIDAAALCHVVGSTVAGVYTLHAKVKHRFVGALAALHTV